MKHSKLAFVGLLTLTTAASDASAQLPPPPMGGGLPAPPMAGGLSAPPIGGLPGLPGGAPPSLPMAGGPMGGGPSALLQGGGPGAGADGPARNALGNVAAGPLNS